MYYTRKRTTEVQKRTIYWQQMPFKLRALYRRVLTSVTSCVQPSTGTLARGRYGYRFVT